MSYPYTVNGSIPGPNDLLSQSQPQIQTNFANIVGWSGVDHIEYGATNSGQHAQVTFPGNNVPTVPTSPPVLFTNVQDGKGNNLPNSIPELFFYSGSAAQGQNNYVSQPKGSVLLLGGIILQWGSVSVSGGGSASFSFENAFPNNVFAILTSTQAVGPFTSGASAPSGNQTVTVYLQAGAGTQTVYVFGIGN